MLIFSSAVDAWNPECMIVEENKMNIPAKSAGEGNVTENEFNAVLDKIEKIYSPIFKEKGKELLIIRKWMDGTVNAQAQQSGNVWKITMFGGLARHEAITPDGFALVACHEIGHHIGGFPKIGSRWASNEGQADYFANAKCLRKYMELSNSIDIMRVTDVPSIVVEKCRDNFTGSEELAMCKRGSLAGLSLGNLFKSIRSMSSPLMFSTPDTTVVYRTNDRHPAPQCRLDTYFAGAICDKDAYDDVDRVDPTKGLCTRVDGYVDGIRPLCWYKPKVQ